MTSNISIYSIPAVFFIGYFPHAYAITIAKKANNNKWNNAGPHTSAWNNRLAASIPAATLARFERAEAAHRNAIETMPLYFTAVVLANLAGLDAGYVNGASVAYMASRVLYNFLYVAVEKPKLSYARTLVWLAGVVGCMTTIVKAGNRLAAA